MNTNTPATDNETPLSLKTQDAYMYAKELCRRVYDDRTSEDLFPACTPAYLSDTDRDLATRLRAFSSNIKGRSYAALVASAKNEIFRLGEMFGFDSGTSLVIGSDAWLEMNG